jgi:alkanesulfonate monooxygenase SsuD/methylene tetrahydromethanopterin reductase-like flavin-dependent oxidoreductase (luciferase family)
MKFSYMADTHFGVYDQPAPGPKEAADAFDQMVDEAVLAEQLGFDGIFLPERHGRGETFVPSPLLAATAIAARTSRIKIATTVLMPTLYNPMHLAEQVAMIDNLSRGRFVLGVGVGYHSGYHRMFGIPWERRGKRFEEAMSILMKAFDGDRFSFHGEFYQLDNVQLFPRTYQRPRVPIWVGTHSTGKPLDRALDHDGWVLWTQPAWKEGAQWVASTRRRAAALGKTDWTFVMNQDGWIGDEPGALRTRHAPRWLREARFYGEHDFDAAINPDGDIGKAEEAEEAIRDFETRQWHFGTPHSWIERIGTIERLFRPDWLNLRLRTPNPGYGPAYPTRAETMAAIRLYGESVIPACRVPAAAVVSGPPRT